MKNQTIPINETHEERIVRMLNTPVHQLDTNFRKDGFDFKLLLRDGDAALLRKTKEGASFENYEVVRIQSHNGYTIAGNYIEPSESMPTSEQWGVKGWTYSDREAAEAKFNQLRK